ncbi:MAG: hypothetical protein JXR51_08220 [Bacteroidales bacterium]|nr:hypothetical protein [Bacteroidales bacterium]
MGKYTTSDITELFKNARVDYEKQLRYDEESRKHEEDINFRFFNHKLKQSGLVLAEDEISDLYEKEKLIQEERYNRFKINLKKIGLRLTEDEIRDLYMNNYIGY